MNRKYAREHYLERGARLRSLCPDIAVTSDFIVGFPGETEADFEQTLSLVREVAYDSIFAFKYSDRPSAPARRFKPKVSEAAKNERLQILLDVQAEITRRKNLSLVGTRQQVLVEGQSKRSGHIDASHDKDQWSGRTSTNKIVHFGLDGLQMEGSPRGAMIRVEIEKALAHSLCGRPLAIEGPPQHLKGERSYAA
jgi:tRNA-2-methylthio-N6-dimethylallyladenosine synthase